MQLESTPISSVRSPGMQPRTDSNSRRSASALRLRSAALSPRTFHITMCLIIIDTRFDRAAM